MPPLLLSSDDPMQFAGFSPFWRRRFIALANAEKEGRPLRPTAMRFRAGSIFPFMYLRYGMWRMACVATSIGLAIAFFFGATQVILDNANMRPAADVVKIIALAVYVGGSVFMARQVVLDRYLFVRHGRTMWAPFAAFDSRRGVVGFVGLMLSLCGLIFMASEQGAWNEEALVKGLALDLAGSWNTGDGNVLTITFDRYPNASLQFAGGPIQPMHVTRIMTKFAELATVSPERPWDGMHTLDTAGVFFAGADDPSRGYEFRWRSVGADRVP
jgi:hypothetical protein